MKKIKEFVIANRETIQNISIGMALALSVLCLVSIKRIDKTIQKELFYDDEVESIDDIEGEIILKALKESVNPQD